MRNINLGNDFSVFDFRHYQVTAGEHFFVGRWLVKQEIIQWIGGEGGCGGGGGLVIISGVREIIETTNAGPKNQKKTPIRNQKKIILQSQKLFFSSSHIPPLWVKIGRQLPGTTRSG